MIEHQVISTRSPVIGRARRPGCRGESGVGTDLPRYALNVAFVEGRSVRANGLCPPTSWVALPGPELDMLCGAQAQSTSPSQRFTSRDLRSCCNLIGRLAGLELALHPVPQFSLRGPPSSRHRRAARPRRLSGWLFAICTHPDDPTEPVGEIREVPGRRPSSVAGYALESRSECRFAPRAGLIETLGACGATLSHDTHVKVA